LNFCSKKREGEGRGEGENRGLQAALSLKIGEKGRKKRGGRTYKAELFSPFASSKYLRRVEKK